MSKVTMAFVTRLGLGLVALSSLCANAADGVAPAEKKEITRIAVFGGSFSVIPPSREAKSEWCRSLNLHYDDYGVGGAGFVANGRGGTNGIPIQVDRALASHRQYDAFLFWASTNDIWNEDKIAQQNASIENCVRKIRVARPTAKILFMTSMPIPLRPKNRLMDYAEAQSETCRRLGIPVLEQHRLVKFPKENTAMYFSRDKLHPNEKGYGFVKDIQVKFLKEELCAR